MKFITLPPPPAWRTDKISFIKKEEEEAMRQDAFLTSRLVGKGKTSENCSIFRGNNVKDEKSEREIYANFPTTITT